MALSWPQLSGCVTWSGSLGHERDQHDALCPVSGEGHRRQVRKDAGGRGSGDFPSCPLGPRVVIYLVWGEPCGKQRRLMVVHPKVLLGKEDAYAAS